MVWVVVSCLLPPASCELPTVLRVPFSTLALPALRTYISAAFGFGPLVDYSQELFEFAIGACGGAVAEVLHWHRVARRGRWPRYARSAGYWFLTAAMLAVSGVVTAAVSKSGSPPLQMLLVGLAAPQFVESMARSRNGRGDKKDVYLGAADASWWDFLGT